ncbi:hypothetical protein BJF78_17980 [Pseudonocardia sp. CNS-139]|nr:hypothetical protein BJF78_17980 [Pseudonocardia sp. CNS-139]
MQATTRATRRAATAVLAALLVGVPLTTACTSTPAVRAPAEVADPDVTAIDLERFLGNGLRYTERGDFGLDRGQLVADPEAPGGTLLRVRYPAGSASQSGSDIGGGLQAYLELPDGPATAVDLEYRVRFPAGFDFVKGGKLPGLYGGTVTSGWNIPDGTDGFSTRYMWRAGGDGEVYAYLPTSVEHGTSLGRGCWIFTPGRWTTIRQRVVLNAPDRDDGRVAVWQDGRQVLDSTGLTFRTSDDLRIDGLFFSTFFGGGDMSWATPVDQYATSPGSPSPTPPPRTPPPRTRRPPPTAGRRVTSDPPQPLRPSGFPMKPIPVRAVLLVATLAVFAGSSSFLVSACSRPPLEPLVRRDVAANVPVDPAHPCGRGPVTLQAAPAPAPAPADAPAPPGGAAPAGPAPAAPPAPPPPLRVTFDPAMNTITVASGQDVPLPDIAAAVANPDALRETAPGEWLLGSHLDVLDGASVQVSAPTVRWLKLNSGVAGFVTLKAFGGGIRVDGACVTSWDTAQNKADTEYTDGRAYVLARDGAEMTIDRAELRYLGYGEVESYGCRGARRAPRAPSRTAWSHTCTSGSTATRWAG